MDIAEKSMDVAITSTGDITSVVGYTETTSSSGLVGCSALQQRCLFFRQQSKAGNLEV